MDHQPRRSSPSPRIARQADWRRRLGALVAASCSVASAAAAIPPPDGSPAADVVVRAPRPNLDSAAPASEQEVVRRFVEGLTDRNHHTQMARWDREVCPVVLGVDPAQTAFVLRRIAEVAALARLKTSAPGCLTQTLVVVTNHADALAASITNRFPITLRRDGRSRMDAFTHSLHPVRWIALRNPCAFGGCGAGDSKLSSGERSAFQAMILIVDADRIEGFKLGELADYLALVILTNPDQRGPWPQASVLSMFDRARETERFALTEDDRRFVQAFYRTRTDEAETSQRAAITERMLRGGAPSTTQAPPIPAPPPPSAQPG